MKLQWLGKTPKTSAGVTWGVPWEEGALKREESLHLKGPEGEEIPVQSWASAFWPDGSVKWSTHAAVAEKNFEFCTLEKGKSALPNVPLQVREQAEHIDIDTGKIQCRMNRKGSSLIQYISRNGRVICSGGKLMAIREEYTGKEENCTQKQEPFESIISKAVVEQAGPVRGVIRVEGMHKACESSREWLPFTLRFYFYAGLEQIKVVHTFIYDGNPEQDFIRGLGMEFAVPLSGPLYNRHVRFAGDTGMFAEASQLLLTWRPRIPREIYERQIEGKKLELDPEKNSEVFANLDNITVWDRYKLIQDSAEHFLIQKRTKEGCCWVDSAHGRRAGGLAFVGSENGGMALGLQNFWQKCPTSLEISQLAQEEGKLKVWFWSPDHKAMDLRHYDTETHVLSYYEGFDEMRSTPVGIANTSELKLWCYEEVPESETLLNCTEELQTAALLVCEPEHYHKTRAFGIWSLTDRSTAVKSYLEDQLDAAVQFYKEEIEQRHWYGFWNYGDIMHTYDPVRHTWRYDMGGYAWQNTELVPNLWLWYAFLRSGREDIFRIAEAMTRHTSEVDVYHQGEYAGLGSRHNVVHWGCGCKEARISMAGHHRFYYYLTGDERTGDILKEVKDADFATLKMDPMRAYYAKEEHPYPTHTRSGPDWAAFCSNWITMWERFEDTAYRDKLLRGIASLKKAPFRLRSGQTFGYDPQTGELFYIGEESGSHLMICMGGPQIWMEMEGLIKDPEWEEMMAEYGEFYCLPAEEKRRRTNGAIKGNGWAFPVFASGMMAYAAAYKKDRSLAEQAWKILLEERREFSFESDAVEPSAYIKPLKELPWVSTNSVSQWALNTIVCLDLIGEELPDTVR